MTRLEKYCLNKNKYPCKEVSSVEHFIDEVNKDLYKENWDIKGNVVPWFRGQKNYDDKPTPAIFRPYERYEGKKYTKKNYTLDEFWLITTFRNRAPALEETPECDRIDKWLFLMQHHKLPTRLLDWTESSLIALFFAVYKIPEIKYTKQTHPSVWMIHPIELNRMTKYITVKDVAGNLIELDTIKLDTIKNDVKAEMKNALKDFPNTWVPGKIGLINFQYAFGDRIRIINNHKITNATEYPIAIQPTYVHSRMVAQKSVFTIHGSCTEDFETIFEKEKFEQKKKYLKKYVIHKKNVPSIIKSLKTLGITNTTIFPDFEGLSFELKERFANTKD